MTNTIDETTSTITAAEASTTVEMTTISVMAPEGHPYDLPKPLGSSDDNDLHAYVAGPMSFIKAFNFPAFIEADAWLNGLGFTDTFNPAVHELEAGVVDYDDIMGREGSLEDLAAMNFSKRHALERDMTAIANADNVFLLPGWERSSGANLEIRAAHWLGVPVWFMDIPNNSFWAVTALDFDQEPCGFLQSWEVEV